MSYRYTSASFLVGAHHSCNVVTGHLVFSYDESANKRRQSLNKVDKLGDKGLEFLVRLVDIVMHFHHLADCLHRGIVDGHGEAL